MKSYRAYGLALSLLVSVATVSAVAKPSKDPRCFTMTPITNFDDKTCAPVKVRIQFKDCTLGKAVENPVEAFARFECHSKPKQLRYWHQQAMLFGDLKKTDDSYEVYKTYSLLYGKASDMTSKDAYETTAMADLSLTSAAQKAASVTVASPTPTPVAVTSPVPPAPVVAAQTPTPTPTPAAATETKSAPAVTPLTPAISSSAFSLLSKVHLTGSVDGYYAYNFNTPGTVGSPTPYGGSPAGNNSYVFPNNYHDQMTLALARVGLYEDANPVGFRIDMGFGPLTDTLAGTGSDVSTRNLMQGYLSYKTPIGLVVEAGKFFSHLGFENVDPSENWNFSYSFLFKFITTTWDAGVRAKMPIGDRLSVSAYLVNGSNSFYQNHKSRDGGAQVKWLPLDSLQVVVNYLGGDEGVGNSDIRNTYEGILVWSPLDSLKVAADYALSVESASGVDTRQVSSLVLDANYNFWERFYVIPRYEIFTDGGVGFGTGYINGQTINSATVGLEYRPEENFRLQLEYRADISNQQPYRNNDGLTGTQTVTTLSGMVLF